MKERTGVKDVFDFVDAFLAENLLPWNKVGSVFTDGAPTMIEHRSGFIALIKEAALHVTSNPLCFS